MKTKLLGYLMLIGLLAGCSSIVHYPNTAPKNVTINMSTDKTSGLFTSVEFSAGINNLKKDCTIDYKGFVDLKAGQNEIGLKTGVPTFLILEIKQDGFNSVRTSQQGTLIKPKKGSKYEVVMKYFDSMIDFRLYEIRKSKRKKLKITPITACKPVI